MRVLKFLPLIFFSMAIVACGGLTQEELDSIAENYNSNTDTSNNTDDGSQPDASQSSLVISWNPIFFDNGSSSAEASSYRVLYSEPGSRPQEAISDENQLALNDVSSLDNYDVLIEGYDSEGNSLFITDYSVM